MSLFDYIVPQAEKYAKKEAFVIVLTDRNPRGLYVKELIEELRKYPKLLMMSKKRFEGAKDWEDAKYGNYVVFGDASPEFGFDYRIEASPTFLKRSNVPGSKIFDLMEPTEKWKKALKKYVKANGKSVTNIPKKKRMQNVNELYVESNGRNIPFYELLKEIITKQNNKTKRDYVSQVEETPKKKKEIEIEIEYNLLDRLGGIVLEIPKSLLFGSNHCYKRRPTMMCNKKKPMLYKIHQTWVKIGLEAYDIYTDCCDRSFITYKGRKYWVIGDELVRA